MPTHSQITAVANKLSNQHSLLDEVNIKENIAQISKNVKNMKIQPKIVDDQITLCKAKTIQHVDCLSATNKISKIHPKTQNQDENVAKPMIVQRKTKSVPQVDKAAVSPQGAFSLQTVQKSKQIPEKSIVSNVGWSQAAGVKIPLIMSTTESQLALHQRQAKKKRIIEEQCEFDEQLSREDLRVERQEDEVVKEQSEVENEIVAETEKDAEIAKQPVIEEITKANIINQPQSVQNSPILIQVQKERRNQQILEQKAERMSSNSEYSGEHQDVLIRKIGTKMKNQGILTKQQSKMMSKSRKEKKLEKVESEKEVDFLECQIQKVKKVEESESEEVLEQSIGNRTKQVMKEEVLEIEKEKKCNDKVENKSKFSQIIKVASILTQTEQEALVDKCNQAQQEVKFQTIQTESAVIDYQQYVCEQQKYQNQVEQLTSESKQVQDQNEKLKQNLDYKNKQLDKMELFQNEIKSLEDVIDKSDNISEQMQNVILEVSLKQNSIQEQFCAFRTQFAKEEEFCKNSLIQSKRQLQNLNHCINNQNKVQNKQILELENQTQETKLINYKLTEELTKLKQEKLWIDQNIIKTESKENIQQWYQELQVLRNAHQKQIFYEKLQVIFNRMRQSSAFSLLKINISLQKILYCKEKQLNTFINLRVSRILFTNWKQNTRLQIKFKKVSKLHELVMKKIVFQNIKSTLLKIGYRPVKTAKQDIEKADYFNKTHVKEYMLRLMIKTIRNIKAEEQQRNNNADSFSLQIQLQRKSKILIYWRQFANKILQFKIHCTKKQQSLLQQNAFNSLKSVQNQISSLSQKQIQSTQQKQQQSLKLIFKSWIYFTSVNQKSRLISQNHKKYTLLSHLKSLQKALLQRQNLLKIDQILSIHKFQMPNLQIIFQRWRLFCTASDRNYSFKLQKTAFRQLYQHFKQNEIDRLQEKCNEYQNSETHTPQLTVINKNLQQELTQIQMKFQVVQQEFQIQTKNFQTEKDLAQKLKAELLKQIKNCKQFQFESEQLRGQLKQVQCEQNSESGKDVVQMQLVNQLKQEIVDQNLLIQSKTEEISQLKQQLLQNNDADKNLDEIQNQLLVNNKELESQNRELLSTLQKTSEQKQELEQQLSIIQKEVESKSNQQSEFANRNQERLQIVQAERDQLLSENEKLKQDQKVFGDENVLLRKKVQLYEEQLRKQNQFENESAYKTEEKPVEKQNKVQKQSNFLPPQNKLQNQFGRQHNQSQAGGQSEDDLMMRAVQNEEQKNYQSLMFKNDSVKPNNNNERKMFQSKIPLEESMKPDFGSRRVSNSVFREQQIVGTGRTIEEVQIDDQIKALQKRLSAMK